MRITDPLNGSTRRQTQKPLDPEEVLLRATATELGIEVDLHNLYSPRLGVRLDVLDGAGAWVASAPDLVRILDSLDPAKPGWHPLPDDLANLMHQWPQGGGSAAMNELKY